MLAFLFRNLTALLFCYKLMLLRRMLPVIEAIGQC